MMKNLIKRMFKTETKFNYILAEYQPGQQVVPPRELPFTEASYLDEEDKDDMQIDLLYQNN
jgi:hypothetical protein